MCNLWIWSLLQFPDNNNKSTVTKPHYRSKLVKSFFLKVGEIRAVITVWHLGKWQGHQTLRDANINKFNYCNLLLNYFNGIIIAFINLHLKTTTIDKYMDTNVEGNLPENTENDRALLNALRKLWHYWWPNSVTPFSSEYHTLLCFGVHFQKMFRLKLRLSYRQYR